ncbi:hypothetical protein GY15_27580 [Delftia sp. 670]|nr:hypothetical protein GY15_27580 [Delftia sp. 670]
MAVQCPHVKALFPTGRHLLHQPAARDEAHAVGHIGSPQQVVRDHENGHALAAQLRNQPAEFGRGLRVQARSGFVQQQRRYLACQRQRNGHLLPHALGKARDAPVMRGRIQPCSGQGLADGIPAGRLARQVQQIGHVLARAQVLVQRHVLGDIGDQAARLRGSRHRVYALHAHLAAARPHKAQEQAQRGGLARAVGAQQRIDLASMHGQVQALEDGALAIVHHGAQRLEHGRGGRSGVGRNRKGWMHGGAQNLA